MSGSQPAPPGEGRTAIRAQPVPTFATPHRDSGVVLDLEPNGDDASTQSCEDDVSKPSKRERIKNFGYKTKRKTKRLLHIDDTSERISDEQDGIIQGLENSPAFNPQKMFDEKSDTAGGTVDKTLSRVQKVAHAVMHPRTTTKHKVATKLAGEEQPFGSREADRELLRAHEELARGELSRAASESSADSEDEEHMDKLEDRVEELEDKRESMAVAWTTSRYVHRVRVVPRFDCPKPEDFEELDEDGSMVFHWEQWLGQRLVYANQDWANRYLDDFDEPPFDREVMLQHIERIIVASGPWQEWLVGLRKIYRWEDRWKTARWFAFFAFLWYLDRTISFFWLYITFIVARRYYQPKSREALRKTYERSINRGASAYRFSDLVHKHGRSEWLDPMAEQMGPYAQLQLADLADYIEILTNFYEWKDPVKTSHTLFFWICCILVGSIASTHFSTRIVTFLATSWFFMGRPIASRYPRYRHMVSPFMWMFWDVPTNAVWSFRYLRRNAQETREQIIAQKVEQAYAPKPKGAQASANREASPIPTIVSPRSRDGLLDTTDAKDDLPRSGVGTYDNDVDVLSLRCRYQGTIGRLVINTSGIRFIRSIPSKEVWRRPYRELAEMRKINEAKLATLKRENVLELKFTDGTSEQIEAMKQRDNAFNAIIGFSGLQWQMLQPGPGKFGNGTASKNKGGVIKKALGLGNI